MFSWQAPMNKTFILALILTIGLASCNEINKDTDRTKIAIQYFNVLDGSAYSKMSDLIADSLTTIEGDYIEPYSKRDYIEFLKWDAVFEPSYKILEINQQNDIVTAKISKTDHRIALLNEAPFITKQTIKFKNDKIKSVETRYLDFNATVWEQNRTALISWINENHPELNGFIHDQTESGGQKFLAAITLYNNKDKSQ